MHGCAICVGGALWFTAATYWYGTTKFDGNVAAEQALLSAANDQVQRLRADDLLNDWFVDRVELVNIPSLPTSVVDVQVLRFRLLRPFPQRLFTTYSVRRYDMFLAIDKRTGNTCWITKSNHAKDFVVFLVWAHIQLRTANDIASILNLARRCVRTGGITMECPGKQVSDSEWHIACAQGCKSCAYVLHTNNKGEVVSGSYVME